MRIGLAQIECIAGDLGANCTKFAEYAKRAKDQGCEVVIFPEMSDTGYVPSIIAERAQPWPGPAVSAAGSAAADNAISLICGISERAGSAIYNTVVQFSRSGEITGKYRKIHLFTASPVHEEKVFTAGNEIATVELGGLNWGLSICYDLRFPELYRALTFAGAHVLLNCSAWPASRPLHWDCLTRARAVENQAFFVGVGRVGTDGGLRMHGHSRVVTPQGEILAEASSDSEELLIADIDPSLINEFRSSIPALSDRRIDMYGKVKGP